MAHTYNGFRWYVNTSNGIARGRRYSNGIITKVSFNFMCL